MPKPNTHWLEQIQSIHLPEALQYPEFQEAWEELIGIRSEMGVDYQWTPRWATLILKKLAFVAEYDRKWPVARIEMVALKGWQGVIFPDDQPFFEQLKKTGVKLSEKERIQKQFDVPQVSDQKMIQFDPGQLFDQQSK